MTHQGPSHSLKISLKLTYGWVTYYNRTESFKRTTNCGKTCYYLVQLRPEVSKTCSGAGADLRKTTANN